MGDYVAFFNGVGQKQKGHGNCIMYTGDFCVDGLGMCHGSSLGGMVAENESRLLGDVDIVESEHV